MDTRKAIAEKTKRRAEKKPRRVAGFIQAWKNLVKKDMHGAGYQTHRAADIGDNRNITLDRG
jgi:hypothetical protein